MSMDVHEFKIRLMRGLIRPEYFYIPVLKRKGGIFVEVLDLDGNPFYVQEISISYATNQLFHGFNRNSSGYQMIYDKESKGYAFDEDIVDEWRFPLPMIPDDPEHKPNPDFTNDPYPDPSDYEILPLPDFTQNPPVVDDADVVSVSQLGIRYAIKSKYKKRVYKDGAFVVEEAVGRSLIELKNMPVGMYTISVRTNDENPWVIDGSYVYNNYPDYYLDYDTDKYTESGYLQHNYCMVDNNNKFSGAALYTFYDNMYGYITGYDFLFSSVKFQNNTMPIIVDTWSSNIYREGLNFIVTRVDIPGYTGETLLMNTSNSYNRPSSGGIGTLAGVCNITAIDEYDQKLRWSFGFSNANVIGGRVIALKIVNYNKALDTFTDIGTFAVMQSFTRTSDDNVVFTERPDVVVTKTGTRRDYTQDNLIMNGLDDNLIIDAVNIYTGFYSGDGFYQLMLGSQGYPLTLTFGGEWYRNPMTSTIGYEALWRSYCTAEGMTDEEADTWLADNLVTFGIGGTTHVERKVDIKGVRSALNSIAIACEDHLHVVNNGRPYKPKWDYSGATHIKPDYSSPQSDYPVDSAVDKNTRWIDTAAIIRAIEDENWYEWAGSVPSLSSFENVGDVKHFYYLDGMTLDEFKDICGRGVDYALLDEGINA